MYIKIKLEPQSLRALAALKNITYFSIEDDADVLTLKYAIERYVDISAERQEIHTLMKTCDNSCLVKELCDDKGSSIMLYAYDEFNEYDKAKFVCFLQVYTDEMAAQQQELEQRLALLPKPKLNTTPNSSASSATLVAISDTEESDSETSSSKSTESDSETSGSSSDNSDSPKKRSKHVKQNAQPKKLKVTASAGGQYSPTLCQYLDEFPKGSEKTNVDKNYQEKNTEQATNSISKEICHDKPSISAPREDLNKNIQDATKTRSNPKSTTTNIGDQVTPANVSAKSLNKIQSNIISTTIDSNIHPCYAINPEIREYLVIISKNDNDTNNNLINNIECEELLVWFFDRFRTCDTSSCLQFDYKTALTLFEGKLWIACMDEYTSEWISASISEYHQKSYRILSLRQTSHLGTVVLPIVSKTKDTLDIFDLLEKQNKNISTLKWCIKSRKTLLPKDKSFNENAISTFCTNEIFEISLDTESRDCIEKLDFKLKYCFWQIVFKFN